ncbi:MAG: hypothetical protein MUC68_18300 [Burkholderiaceae bacterium]|jgi:hypothetical protein|nr:hypothetical protein [Burkholderiaceae bacterium]
MNGWIAAFLVAGVLFGLATFRHRHWFSEGPTRRSGLAPRDPLDGRALWVLLCSALWPIFALTGLYSLWRSARR